MVEMCSGLLKDAFYILGQGFHLAPVIGGHDDKKIREGTDLADVQQQDIGSLHFGGYINGSAGVFNRVQAVSFPRVRLGGQVSALAYSITGVPQEEARIEQRPIFAS